MNLCGFDKAKHRFSIFLLLFLLALIVRAGMMIFTIDVPGDGPTRATAAYQMFLSPTLFTYGDWLPGYNYLHYGFYYILANPAVTSRVVNVILGALTVPLFYMLTATIFDHPTALISALVLVFLPLHVGLSASSLTEPTFLFEFISGSLTLTVAANTDRYRFLYLFLAIFLLSLAIMTRYEGWLLIPIFVAYDYLRRHSIVESVVLATALSIYPTIWTISNDLHSDQPFLGFTAGTGWFHGAKPVTWLQATTIIIDKCVDHLGWMFTAAMVLGLALQCIAVFRRQCTLERLFYSSAVLIDTVAIYSLTMARGYSLWDRYLLFGFVVMLPFAVLPFTSFAPLRRSKWGLVTISLLLIMLVAYNPQLYKTLGQSYNNLYVTRWQPTEIINVAAWLKHSPYQDYVILLTENYGQSSYFPTYLPAKALQHCVIAWYSEDAFIGDYCLDMGRRLHIGNNYLFITSDEDRAVKRRVEKIVGGAIGRNRLVHTEGHVRVYDISTLLESRQFPDREKSK